MFLPVSLTLSLALYVCLPACLPARLPACLPACLCADSGQDAMLALPRSSDGWLKQSPFPVPTERDRVCELKWRPVWRMMLRRRETQKQTP